MNSRQIKALTCHDRKTCNGVIKENAEVYVYLSRHKSDKLSLKWTWSVRIIKKKHPLYLIEYQKQRQMVTKWTTREKLRQTEQNQNDIYNRQSNTLILYNESSEEIDKEKNTISRYNDRYVRQDIRLPQRYDIVYAHLVDDCHSQFISGELIRYGGGILWSMTSNERFAFVYLFLKLDWVLFLH